MADGKLTPAELAEIEAREKAATQGPWWTNENDLFWQLFADATRRYEYVDEEGRQQALELAGHPLQLIKAAKRETPYAEYWPTAEDAAFIAAARTDIPALLAHIRAQEEEIARLEGARAAALDEFTRSYLFSSIIQQICHVERARLALGGRPMFTEEFLADAQTRWKATKERLRLLEARTERCREVLAPFARLADRFDDPGSWPWPNSDDVTLPAVHSRATSYFTLGQLRAARAVFRESAARDEMASDPSSEP